MTQQLFTITVEGNLLVVTRLGTQTAKSVEAIRYEILQRMQANPALRDVLVIVKTVTDPDEPTKQASTQSLREIPFNRIAIVTGKPKRLTNAKGIVKASEAGDDRVKIFRSEEDARAWLEEEG